jgi:lactate dehydrogenase-like 2-hydroxyacid dehydrogenase
MMRHAAGKGAGRGRGRPVALLLFEPSVYLASELHRRFEALPWYRCSRQDRAVLLDREGARVQVVVTNGKTGCEQSVVERLPSLRLIAVHGVGYDRLDLAMLAERHIAVTNTPDTLTDDVADLALGLVVGLLRNIPAADRFVRQDLWKRAEFRLATRVSGKRFGILGMGRIGEAIALRLQPFGTVSYTSRQAKPVPWTYYPDVVSLAAANDVLLIACAANDQTRGLVGAEVLAALGSRGYLVNVARGSIADEDALQAALDRGTLAGAALDVFADEPALRAELCASERTVLTPHIGSATEEARKAMADRILANLDAWLEGLPLPDGLLRNRD